MVTCGQLLETNIQRNFTFKLFSVQKFDEAVPVNYGLSQATMHRLEKVMLGPFGAHLLIIDDILRTGHGSVSFVSVLTIPPNEKI